MTRPNFLSALAVLFLGTLAGALPVSAAARDAKTSVENLPMAAPESVGMSSDRLDRLRAAMQGYIARDEIAGTVVLVARRGKVVHFQAQGLKHAAEGEAMTTDTIFRIASMTKPITSVALMMLWEEGALQLRDPISKWLPEYAEMDVAVAPAGDEYLGSPYKRVPAAGPITVQHILTHTAGLANSYRGLTRGEYQELGRERQPGDTTRDDARRLAELPLNFEPGSQWEYGPATNLVGDLVTAISGLTLDEFFQQRIFAPLGMVDTHFYLPASKLPRVASLYRPDEDGKIALTEKPSIESRFVAEPHVYFAGAGGLLSTAADYWRFHQLMLNGGELDGVRLLSPKTVELMTVNHIGDLGVWLRGPGYGFGLGYSVKTDKGPSASPAEEGSYGWGGAFNTTFWVDPEEELIGILMSQIRPYTHLNIRADLESLTYQAIVE